MFTLSACGVSQKIAEVSYRSHQLKFEEWEYQQTPGVLMRASVVAWEDYDETEKLAAIVDYYVDPAQRLQSESTRFKWGMAVEQAFHGKYEIPLSQELSHEEAQKRVQCLNVFSSAIPEKHRILKTSRDYPLFKVEAHCNEFLSRNPIPIECIGWQLSTSQSNERVGSTIITRYDLMGKVVNKCAS